MAVIVKFPHTLTNGSFLAALLGSVILALAATERQDARDALFNLAAWLPAAYLIVGAVLLGVHFLTPHTIDAEIDFGFACSIMDWASQHSVVDLLFRMVYAALLLAMSLALASSEEPYEAARCMLLAALLAVPLYIAFPACGPRWALDPSAPRNCIPSLHLTWALIFVYVSSPRFRWLFAIFAVLTAIATLTTGEHYLIDLIVAVPFSMLCIWVCEPPSIRVPENERAPGR
jgi:hypothetical protein